MSIVSLSTEVLPFLELSADDSFSNVARVQAGVEQYVKGFCGREFESTTYKEIHRDVDTESLFLKQFPVLTINRLSFGTDSALTIWNTNTDTSAIVNVSSTEIVLTYNGVDDSADLTFATNKTINSLVTAINAIGSGWTAEAVSGFGNYQSTELIKRFGAETIKSTRVSLKVPDTGIQNYEVDESNGEISFTKDTKFHSTNFSGIRSFYMVPIVYCNYTAGYTSTTMPDDLKLAILKIIKLVYSRIEEELEGVTDFTVDKIRKSIDDLPADAIKILYLYKIWEI